GKSQSRPVAASKTILFVLPRTTQFGGLERHLLDFVRRLNEPQLRPLIVCFDQDIISSHMEDDLLARVAVKCESEPKSLWDWLHLIRKVHPDAIVFIYSWVEAFPWQASVAA